MRRKRNKSKPTFSKEKTQRFGARKENDFLFKKAMLGEKKGRKKQKDFKK